MPIEVRIHAPEYQSATPYEQIADTLRNLPGMQSEGTAFVYQDEETDVFLDVMPGHDGGAAGVTRPGPDSAGQCSHISVRFPADLKPEARESVADFVFGLARRFGWKVYESDGASEIREETALARRLSGSPLEAAEAQASRGCTSVLLLAAGAFLLLTLLH